MEIRKILEAVKNAYIRFKNAFALGVTADALFSVFQDSLREDLGEYEIVYDYIWGKDSGNIDGVTQNYTPQTGDALVMDISVCKDGVWCDVCRTFFVGEPTDKQKEIFAMIKASLRRGQATLTAGAKASDIYRAVNTVYETNGKTLVHHAGHRIAETPVAQPQFLAENETPIKAGETYAIESGYYEKGAYGIRLENDFLVSENGAEDLFEDLLPLDLKEYILR